MKIDKDAIQALKLAIEKCGGPGGTPGPCAGPRKPKKPPKPTPKPEGPNGSYSREQLQAANRRIGKVPPGAGKPPKKPAANANRRFTQREQEQWDAHDAKKKPPKKPDTKPQELQTADGLKKELKKKDEAITKARKEVLTLAKSLGFKPTSKDAFINEQQALEWAQVRAAKNLVAKEITADVKPKLLAEASQTYSRSEEKIPPKEGKPPAASKPGKKKPPKKDPLNKPYKPPKGPALPRESEDARVDRLSRIQNPAAHGLKPPKAKKSKIDTPSNEAKSILELTKSPETRKVAVEHPTIARLAGRKFADVVKAVAGMKPSEVWPNRQQAAKNLIQKFKTEFTDENAEKLIDTAVAHVKKVFTKEGAAARIMSHFLKEQPW